MAVDPTFPFVKNLLCLDSEGKRVAVKYYSDDFPTTSAQNSFEKTVFQKTIKTPARGEAEVTLFDDFVVVYKCQGDLQFFVTGSQDDNELILYAVLQAFYESVSTLLRGNVDKRSALENLDLIVLVMDEIIDGGLVLEIDSNNIATRVMMRGPDGEGGPHVGEPTFSQALQNAKEQIAKQLLK
eukprot:TRINITY_DN1095_c0_g2_i1.p1 TRINITY_DN1095_c0_g2~~TRINITY_DN1095_c0_g2_i1.p1  ORF type:complete len:215 (-),score=27.32 TRINITY_DN1095_c0_g2_i1:389-937(-)